MNFRSKKGAVAVYAFLSMIILTTILLSIYFIVSIRHRSQLKTVADIRREVEQYNLNSEIEIIENPTEIPIYDETLVEKMGFGEYVYIPQEDKIYKFTDTAIYKKYTTVDSSAINIGDIVYYDPTIGVTNPNDLKYRAVTGSAQAGSNASGTGNTTFQDFEATASDIRWIVIGKASNGQLKLISEDLKKNTVLQY